jgi:hypothetical protein
MSLYDTLGDVEAEARAASIIPGDLKGPLENRFQLIGGDPRARVADGEAYFVSDAFDVGDYSPVWRGELDRVTEKIDEHLKNPGGIKRSPRRWRHDLCQERDPACRCLRLKGIHSLRHDVSRVSSFTG